MSHKAVQYFTTVIAINYASSANYQAQGGAIYNTYYSSGNSSNGIGNVSGDFVGNYVEASREAQGGAIYNNNSIDSITGSFSNNYAVSSASGAFGGAIYNNSNSYAKIGSITADFIGNYVYAIGNSAGGAILTILMLLDLFQVILSITTLLPEVMPAGELFIIQRLQTVWLTELIQVTMFKVIMPMVVLYITLQIYQMASRM